MERRRKRELRDLNLKVWAGESDVFPIHGSLDSSMKKNTAFIKRLRTALTSTGLSTFLQEIRTLSLHKYLSEIISACYEGLCKVKSPGEIAAGVEVVSALHQRFGANEFTRYIGWLIGRGLSTPDRSHLKALAADVREREEKERLVRQRALLRVATELWLVGVLRSLDDVSRPEEAGGRNKEGPKAGDHPMKNRGSRTDADAEPFPLEVLKDMLGHDREHANLPLVALFVKSFAWDILGVKMSSAEGRKPAPDDGPTATADGKHGGISQGEEEDIFQDPPITSLELCQRFKNILARYFDDVKAHLIRDQKMLVNQGRRNAEAYVKSGEVFEDRQANYEKQVKAQEKLLTNAQVLADAVGAEMPDLSEKDPSANANDASVGLVKAGDYLRGQSDGPGIWEDEEERRFYENLIDLKDRVPSILLTDAKKKRHDNDEQVGKKADSKPAVHEAESKEDTASSPSTTEVKPTETDDQSTAIANKSVGAQVDVLLAKLPELVTKDMVDQMAMDFCFLNSKASRNRLIKSILEVPKGRSDLLPLYARLVATLSRYMPDVSQGLVSHLDDEFRSLQRRKQKEFLGQVRTQNIRYLAELTKFGVVPEHIIFHCLKVSLDDFSRVNIEIMGNLLENCGRYLLRNPETAPRMVSFLETLQRKKSAQLLGQQERMLIENAIYYVNPPERAAIEQKERTPIELFLRKLIYVDLNRRNWDKISKQIRKLHWEEDEVVSVLEKIFSKPGKIKYSYIYLLAVVLGSLNRYHLDFTVSIIDNLLESITLGLEINDFKFSQRRIAEVKYLGEMYIYKMVDSPVVFDALYNILTYGYEGGVPRPGYINPLDPPDDYFRIRLVCTLLETCGVYYHKGHSKKKLDFFLTFFQFYYRTKDDVPMDIEFLIQDAYAMTRPQWKIAGSLDEAFQLFAEAVKQNYQISDKTLEPEEPDESSSDDDADDVQLNTRDVDDARSSADDGDATADDEPAEAAAWSEDEQIVVTRQEEERDPEADAEFEREFAKLMTESMDSRKNERKPVFDVPLPMRRAQRESTLASEEVAEPSSVPPASMMQFSLLSKRGNKQQARSIAVPSDSTFAVAMRSQQQAEKAEQQRIKNLVLNYDLRDETEADGGIYDVSSTPLQPNPNRRNLLAPSKARNGSGNAETSADPKGIDRQHSPYTLPRVDKSGSTRYNQRARKLQLSDVDWYGSTRSVTSAPAPPGTAPSAVDSSVGPAFERGKDRDGKLGCSNGSEHHPVPHRSQPVHERNTGARRLFRTRG